jgi:hypothetical protein
MALKHLTIKETNMFIFVLIQAAENIYSQNFLRLKKYITESGLKKHTPDCQCVYSGSYMNRDK